MSIPQLYAFRQFVTDKESFGFDADGARYGETPNVAMDAETPELARLIAAAPDMLNALVDAMHEIARYAGVDLMDPPAWFKSAHRDKFAAIAAARGEA
jgi:hypothetical protein